jgi:hypothetical protein
MLLVAGLGFVAGPMAMAFAASDASSGLGNFDVTAEATGIGATFGDPGSQPYPTAAGLAPNAVAQLGTGPAGLAYSSVMWPGPLAGNAGGLVNVIGTPLPPDVVANGNDPVKAQAAASGGARDEQTVGPMYALVDNNDSKATTALTDFAAPGIVSAARVVTTSRSYLDSSGRAVSVAESVLEGVEIAGVIKIENVHTIAKGTTDGSQATTEQQVVVSGATAQGQGISIDDKGLHTGPQTSPNPVDPAIGGLDPLLKGMSMRAFVTKPLEQRTQNGSAVMRTGSVVFEWKMGGGPQIVTVVLGGSSITMSATPGSSFGLGDNPVTGGSGDLGSAGFTSSVGSGTVGLGAPGGAGLVPSAGRVATRPAGTNAGPVPFELASSMTDRVPLGWMIIGVLGMCLIGMSLHGLREQALDAALAGSTCPLERGAS